jgi:hemerythrin superfamily protein
MSPTATKPSSKDAISLLTQDHKEVKAGFKQFEALGDRAFVAKKKLADEICSALTTHTTVEEEIFYPAVRKAVEDGDDIIDEATVEHACAKELISQIVAMSAEDDLFDAKVKVLSDIIDHHVLEEEKEMFVKARKANLDLAELGKEILARKDQLPEAASATWLHGHKPGTQPPLQPGR